MESHTHPALVLFKTHLSPSNLTWFLQAFFFFFFAMAYVATHHPTTQASNYLSKCTVANLYLYREEQIPMRQRRERARNPGLISSLAADTTTPSE